MGRVIKLILYYFCYQILFQFAGVFLFWVWSCTQVGGIAALEAKLPLSLMLFWSLVSSIAYSIHLIHFRYLQLNHTTMAIGKPATWSLYLPMGICFILFFNCINDWLDLPDIMGDTFLAAKDSIWGILSICIAAPLFEEFLFRGAIQGHLQKVWHQTPRLAILASAFLFGIIHGNPAQISFAFLFGLVIGELYYRSGSMMPGILLHFINNTTAMILMHLYPETTTLDELIPPTIYWTIAVVSLGVGIVLYNLYLQQVKVTAPAHPLDSTGRFEQ
ncbi:MAG: lysostaphin resistance A-like protein [Phocaeicola sp.]